MDHGKGRNFPEKDPILAAADGHGKRIPELEMGEKLHHHAAELIEENDPKASENLVRDFIQWFVALKAAFGKSFLAVVMIVYGVSQGYGETIKAIATNYYWKDVQKLEPASTQAFQAISTLPWDIKPLYGLVTDTFPIAGFRRWPYLAACGIAGTLCLWALAVLPTPTPWVATALLSISALCTAFPDVVTDAAIAQNSRDSPQLASDLQSLSWGSMAVGGLLGCGISGSAIHSFGSKGSYLLISIAPLLLILAAWALPESRLPRNLWGPRIGALMHTFGLFLKTLQNPIVWKPALYIYLFSGGLCPDISEAMFYWLTDKHVGPGFSEEFIGFMNAFGYLAMVLGIVLYNCWFKGCTFRTMFFWTQFAVCATGFLDLMLVTRYNLRLHLPDHAFVLGDQAISNAIGRLQLMPMLVLSAKICPPGIEGTIFAFLMSVSNLGGTTSSWLGAVLLKWLHVKRDDYKNLWLAVIIRSTMRLSPLLFLFLVPQGTPDMISPPSMDNEISFESNDRGEACKVNAQNALLEDELVHLTSQIENGKREEQVLQVDVTQTELSIYAGPLNCRGF